MLTAAINFFIQFAMFLVFWVIFFFNQETFGALTMTGWVVYLPVCIIQVMLLGLAVGIIVSSLTTKYRDLAIAVTFGVQLWMYATPVVYSTTSLSNQPLLSAIVNLNPMTAPVQVFRMALLGCGSVSVSGLWYSLAVTAVLLIIGVVLFSRIEKTFMDTV